MCDKFHHVAEASLAHGADLRERDAKLWLLWHCTSELKLVHQLLLLLHPEEAQKVIRGCTETRHPPEARADSAEI